MSFLELYEMGAMIGSGAFGQVRLCWPLGDPAAGKLAVKAVDLEADELSAAAQLLCPRQEVLTLRQVRHPHVVELIDAFEEGRWIFLVMERISGGDLFAALGSSQVSVTERHVANVGRQLFQALQHLHERRIVHRDVKAENVLLASAPLRPSEWFIKLIDFGLALKLERPTCIFGQTCQVRPIGELVCGTAYYCAPEVWSNEYGPKVDTWAAGVLLYLALHGRFPFYDRDVGSLEDAICSPRRQAAFEPVGARECPGYEVSNAARSCLSSLLVKEPQQRYSAGQALLSPWLADLKSRTLGWKALEGEGRYIPLHVRQKASRAGAKPPLDTQREEARTRALQMLQARGSLCLDATGRQLSLAPPMRAPGVAATAGA